jgi:hypothetical protein
MHKASIFSLLIVPKLARRLPRLGLENLGKMRRMLKAQLIRYFADRSFRSP